MKNEYKSMNFVPSTRREFLRTAGVAAGLAMSPSAFAKSLTPTPGASGKGTLVCIYLRGGADFLNMIVPYRDDDYHQARPTLSLHKEDGLVELDSKFGLHPGLSAFAPLWKAKKIAAIVATGSPHPTRSHFDAQDFMEFAAPGNRTVRNGWLNRYLAATQKKGASEFRAMAIQELLPRSLRGNYPVLAVPSSMEKRKGEKTLSRFEEFYGAGTKGAEKMKGEMMERPDEKIVESGRITIKTLRRYRELLAKGKSTVRYGNDRIGKRLQSIAKVLKAGAGLEIAGVDVGGWDDHANQGSVEGNHHTRLANLSGGIASFCEDLGEQLDKTTIVIMTEFGRTVRENGNNGTDHGHGGGMFVIGGGVRGGRIFGDWKGLGPGSLYNDRDLPVTTDFRDVMAEILHGTFGFKAPRGFFPDYKPGRINLF